MARYDPAGTAHNPAASGPAAGAAVRWEAPVDSAAGPAAPIAIGGAVVLSRRGGLVALDRETGRVRFERGGYSYLSSPTRAPARAYRSDVLAVRGREGLHGLAADGGYEVAGRSVGLERWHAPGREPTIRTSATPVEPSPVAVEGTIYASLPEAGSVVAVDASSGRLRWRHVPGDPRSTRPNRPAVRDGTVYVAAFPDLVAAIDAETGAREWLVRLQPGEPERAGDYRRVNAPTVTQAGLVVPGRRAVSLLDPAGGDRRWEYVHDGRADGASVAVADGRVFVADGDESLHAVDLETGDGLWTAEYRRSASPIVAGGVVYLSDDGVPELVAVDAASGDRLWSHEIGHRPSQPVAGDGVLYVVVDDRVLALEGDA